MKSFFACLLLLVSLSLSAQPDTRYFEMRIYYCYPRQLSALVERFEKNTTRIFEKHGMENIGYWVPTTNDKNALYYILAYPSKEARDKSWAGFMADPEWKEVAAKSEANGKIVESVTSIFMNASDILPQINATVYEPDRLFELRTYTCLPGRLPNLITRFKDHTVKLFEKHGMQNIAYFTSIEKDGAQSKLVYLLAHKSEEEGTKSFAAFRADPVWIAARDASEKDGKIVEKVETLYLKPLSFSKIK
jgi:NIPSNAP